MIQIIKDDLTPNAYAGVFAQLLANEVVFVQECDVEYYIQTSMSQPFKEMLKYCLNYSTLKYKARKIITEMTKFQIVAQHPTAVLPDHYQKIQKYFVGNPNKLFVQYNFLDICENQGIEPANIGFTLEFLI